MKDIGIFLVKLSAFVFIGIGASVASIVLPMMQYEKEAVTYLYKAAESMGKTPTEESCTLNIAKESFAECKIGLHMAKKHSSYMGQYITFANIFLRIGIISFLLGAGFYLKKVFEEKKEKGSGKKTI